MKTKFHNNNKGFSLVELIIVIAIMAILAGALAPALIKYIDKARKAALEDSAKLIYDHTNTAIAEYLETEAAGESKYFYDGDKVGCNQFKDSVDGETCGRITTWTFYRAVTGGINWASGSGVDNYLGSYICNTVANELVWCNINPSETGRTIKSLKTDKNYDKNKYVATVVYTYNGVKRVEVSKGDYFTVYDGGEYVTKSLKEDPNLRFTKVFN